ncbi:helix-turn-helix domain-containing protein [Streptomyces djakartensis]|uniref:helix-turn-helix domain-containing protein n=1 Tax=Streptomyces djakartensis TaxID=68193 RepID=UPI0034DDF963
MTNDMQARHRLPPGPQRTQLATELKTQYDQGKSIRTLAKETGRSYSNIHTLLEEAGTTFRPRGGIARPHTADN